MGEVSKSWCSECVAELVSDWCIWFLSFSLEQPGVGHCLRAMRCFVILLGFALQLHITISCDFPRLSYNFSCAGLRGWGSSFDKVSTRDHHVPSQVCQGKSPRIATSGCSVSVKTKGSANLCKQSIRAQSFLWDPLHILIDTKEPPLSSFWDNCQTKSWRSLHYPAYRLSEC